MGLNTTERKKNDRTRLPALKGGGGSANTSSDQIKCLTSFTVPLTQSKILTDGVALSIDAKGAVIAYGNQVGRISARRFSMVDECKKIGVHYHGEVASRKSDGKRKYYGIFRQR